MRIGYFGGSFDPPHRGHLTVARAARSRFALDRVLLAPTGRQPLKPDGPAAPFADRLAMTTLLCAGEPGLEASTIDAPRPDGSPNYTVDTLHRLRRTLPAGAEIFTIVGADAFLHLPKWRDASLLFDLATWVVVSRPGYTSAQLAQVPLSATQRPRVHWLKDVTDPTSATELRARLRAGLPCESLLSPEVSRYIEQHGLYLA